MQDTHASRVALPIPSRRPPSPEAQDSFLSRSCPIHVMDDPYRSPESSTSCSVGSNGSTHTFGTPLNREEQPRPTRTRLGNRMDSPPIIPQRRGKSTSRTRPVTMFTSLNRASPKPEWSVFEQRMENEGQMRTKNILNEGAAPSPFHQTEVTGIRSESPIPGAPSLRRVVVEQGHDSDDPSTIGYDSESDVEDSSESSTPISIPSQQKRRWYSKWNPPPLTPLQRNILKCAVAYFIGSLFTFNSTLSGLITSVISTGDESAPSQSGHMVATV
jgi:hypothetical protein